MTNKMSKSKSAVRAAREAVKAAQREVLERAARNADDLAVFFSNQERLAGVEEWVQAKVDGLHAQAEGKRAEHRRAAGLALRALRDRGETMRDIAGLAGIGEKAVRDMIRYADTPAGRDGQAAAAARDDGAVEASVAAAAGLGGRPDVDAGVPPGGAPRDAWSAAG